MDNVTHTVAGLLLAESAIRLRARRAQSEPSPRWRAVAAISSIVGANLPDADLFYAGLGGDHLGYMLHHRGHTHTVVLAILGALLLSGAAILGGRWRASEQPAPNDNRWLAGLLFVSTLSHLALDWTNSYGIHPFWPIDNRWRYGDMVFIVEPWLWVVSIPTLVAASNRRSARVLLSLLLLAGIVLAWNVDLVSTGAAAALTLGALLSIALTRALRPDARVAAAVAAWLCVTLVMAAGSSRARATTVQAARAADSAAELLDVVVSPLPANPLCMSVITVERSEQLYRVMTARVSAMPAIARATNCGVRPQVEPMLGASTRPSTSAIHWDREWTAPSADLPNLVVESCPALAAMRFIRVPIWKARGDATVLLGDVRYGGGSGNGFTDVRVPHRSAACPRGVPPWTPPRADLLGID